MKKVGKIVASLFLVVLVILYWQRGSFLELTYNRFAQGSFVSGDSDSFDPGPARGSFFPGLQAAHNERRVTLLSDFSGASGTVLVILRSLVTSSICREQLLQLQTLQAQFKEAHISLVVISPDTTDFLEAFASEHDITIPLLSDTTGLSFLTLGVIDHANIGRDNVYGLPLPGTIVLSRDQKIIGKLFLEEAQTRVDGAATLSFARQVLEQ